ncbi:1-phosphofructokinase family hexose kinase [Thioclava sp. BHET1]|nr:1-phosphofructokinase family hexose kinase [Thioclava sp. BHET1]
MRAILTITLNPTVDLAVTTEAVQPERKLRCSHPLSDPGGGGLNVSRAIAALGGNSTAFAALGGPNGDQVMRLLAAAGIGVCAFPAPGETRLSLTATDQSTGAQYRFVMPGPEWSARDVSRALSRIARAAPEGGIVVLSGSQPPGVPPDFPAQLASRISRTQARLFLDTSGPPLHHLLSATAPPAGLLRMDALEAEELAGRPLPERKDSADFAQDLVRRGVAEVVLVARGSEGNVLATREARWFAQAARVPVVSKVGAGDSFVAAFTLALSRGKSLPEALQDGAAAASAAVMSPATDLCRASDMRRLRAQCPVSEV